MEFGSVRPARLPRRAMQLVEVDRVKCRAEVTAADVERFGASLSSDQRALVMTFDTDGVKFTAWPELSPVPQPGLDTSATMRTCRVSAGRVRAAQPLPPSLVQRLRGGPG